MEDALLIDNNNDMKRSFLTMSMNMDKPNEYQLAMKKVNLVERNPTPNGHQLLNVRNVGKHQADDIIVLAQEIQTAHQSIRTNATGKLSLILDQIRFLQAQAYQILEDTDISKKIHDAACNFRKVPGKTYHLYIQDSGQTYLSMLSPDEWGTSLKSSKFQGSFRLENDQTWTPIDRLSEISQKNAYATRLLDAPSPAGRNKSFLAIDECD